MSAENNSQVVAHAGADLLLVGTSRFSAACALGLARRLGSGITVWVAGRDGARLGRFCAEADHAAGKARKTDHCTFRPMPASLRRAGAMAVLASAPFAGIIVATSGYSPSLAQGDESRWAALVRDIGFGFTVALQASIVVEYGRAIAAMGTGAWLVNACYPDLANALVARLGISVVCGVGNAATLAAVAERRAQLSSQEAIHLFAHHTDLAGKRGNAPPLWLGDIRIDVDHGPAAAASLTHADIVRIGGDQAGRLVAALLQECSVPLHAPGPLGMIGGYPIWARKGTVSLRLPNASALEVYEGVLHNEEGAIVDGATVVGARIEFPRGNSRDLHNFTGGLSSGFDIQDFDEVLGRFEQLRAAQGGRMSCP